MLQKQLFNIKYEISQKHFKLFILIPVFLLVSFVSDRFHLFKGYTVYTWIIIVTQVSIFRVKDEVVIFWVAYLLLSRS